MAKDARYTTVKNLISGGYIKTLREMFPTIPKSVLAKDLGISLDRFNNMITDVERLSVKTMFRIAALLEVEGIQVMTLVYNQHQADSKGKRKK